MITTLKPTADSLAGEEPNVIIAEPEGTIPLEAGPLGH